ncbi:MAG: hypothetical protein DRI57_31520, partial [Deltaproteobacteria bacterium]
MVFTVTSVYQNLFHHVTLFICFRHRVCCCSQHFHTRLTYPGMIHDQRCLLTEAGTLVMRRGIFSLSAAWG